MKYDELRQFYKDNFSLGFINTKGRSNIESRFILISLICYVTYKTKLKKPDTTHYQIIMKLSNYYENYLLHIFLSEVKLKYYTFRKNQNKILILIYFNILKRHYTF